MWANSLSVHVEVNVIDDRAEILLGLTTTQASRRATPYHHQSHPPAAPEIALAESESSLQSSRGAWKHLEALRSTGVCYQSVWEVGMWLLDRFTFC